MNLLTLLCGLSTAVLIAGPTHADPPSFNCAKAQGSAEKLICRDNQLAQLDREVARLFTLARAGRYMTAERRRKLLAVQRGWIKGRNDCWKAADLRTCVRDSYMLRIHELRQGYAGARTADAKGISRGPFVLQCTGLAHTFAVDFVNAQPALVILVWHQKELRNRVLTIARSASGARYMEKAASGPVMLWLKGKTGHLDTANGKSHRCRLEEIG